MVRVLAWASELRSMHLRLHLLFGPDTARAQPLYREFVLARIAMRGSSVGQATNQLYLGSGCEPWWRAWDGMKDWSRCVRSRHRCDAKRRTYLPPDQATRRDLRRERHTPRAPRPRRRSVTRLNRHSPPFSSVATATCQRLQGMAGNRGFPAPALRATCPDH